MVGRDVDVLARGFEDSAYAREMSQSYINSKRDSTFSDGMNHL